MKLGFTLIPVVIFIATVSFLSLSAFERMHRLNVLYRERTGAKEAKVENSKSLLNQLSNPLLATNQELTLISATGSSGKTSIERTALVLPLKQPALHLENIFSGAKVCPSHSGLCRGARNLCTNRLCESLEPPGKFLGSLVNGQRVDLPADNPAFLAATGDIELATLALASETIVIAGGDILIDTLSRPKNSRLTLISVRGAINVRSMSGSGAVTAVAEGEVSIPPMPVADNGLRPPALQLELVGIMPPS